MNFSEALETLKVGKKIRRETSGEGFYIYLTQDNKIINNSMSVHDVLSWSAILASNWEIYQEEKENENDSLINIIDKLKDETNNTLNAMDREIHLKSNDALDSLNIRIVKTVENLIGYKLVLAKKIEEIEKEISLKSNNALTILERQNKIFTDLIKRIENIEKFCDIIVVTQ